MYLVYAFVINIILHSAAHNKMRPYVPFRNDVRVLYAYGKNEITFCRISHIHIMTVARTLTFYYLGHRCKKTFFTCFLFYGQHFQL